MKRYVMVTGAIGMSAMLTGCMSVLSMKSSENEIAKRRVFASGNQEAIRAIQNGSDARQAIRAIPMGNNGFGVGIDITALESLTEHPVRQIGALLLDAGTAYGVYLIGDNQNWWGGGNSVGGDKADTTTTTTSTSISSGRDTDQVNISGNGNTVIIEQNGAAESPK
jgi:hypothetical protein